MKYLLLMTFFSCGIIIDAMAIQKKVCVDPRSNRKIGWVDFGIGEDSDVLAKEALTIMLVGHGKVKWKAPIAYSLTNGVSADTQVQLLLACITASREIGLRIHALTLDGAATNVTTVKRLVVSWIPQLEI